MTVLALGVETNYLTLEKSDLEYQDMVCGSEKLMVSTKLSNLAAANANNDSFDMATNPQALALQAFQKMYDSKSASIESQLKVINAEIDGYKKAIDTNVKNDFKLNISV